MSGTFDRIALWLADNLHLSTMLLAGALVLVRFLKQPVRRLVVAKATIMAMFLLAILVALPGWSIIHLCLFEDHAPPPAAASPSSSSSLAVALPPIAPQSAAPENLATPTAIHKSSISLPALTWPQIIVGIYAAGAATVFAWLALGTFAATRLIRTSQPAPPELARALASINPPPSQGGARGGFSPALRTSPHIQVPVALGLTHPTIILPSSWLTQCTSPPFQGGARGGLSANELRIILAHEQAHIQNGDLRWLAIGRALLILFWPQPLYWLLRRQMRLDQESLADAAAADLTDRHEYAEHLVTWARALPRNTRPSLTAAVGLWESPSQLRRGISLLLNDRLTILRQCPRVWRLATTAIALIAAAALSPITLQPLSHAETSAEKPDRLPKELHPIFGASQAASSADDKGQSDASPNAREVETRHTVQGSATFVPGPLPTVPTNKKNAIVIGVVDIDGKPITGVEVRLYSASLRNGSAEFIKQSSSNDAGEVEFADVVPESSVAECRQIEATTKIPAALDSSFILALRHPGLTTEMFFQSDFEVALHGFHRAAKMRPAAELRGRATDPEGRPVAGALVAAGNWAGTFVIEGVNAVRTDSDGQFKFTDLVTFDAASARKRQANEFRLATAANRAIADVSPKPFDPADDLAVSDLVVTHPDFAVAAVQGGNVPGTTNVQMAPAAAIAGRVVHFDSGKPAAGVLVKAAGRPKNSTELLPDEVPSSDSVHSAATRPDEQGRYRLANLPAGTYGIWAQPESSDWQTMQWVCGGINDIEAKAGKAVQAPDLTIGPPGTIHGQLIDATTGQPLSVGDDSPAVSAMFHSMNGVSLQEVPLQTVPCTSDGSFELRALPGKMRVFVSVRLHKDTDFAKSDFRSDDDFYRSGPILELNYGENIDSDFSVRSVAWVEEIRTALIKANELMMKHQLPEAIAAFTEILANHPDNAPALRGRAYVHLQAGQIPETVADFESLLKLTPDDFEAQVRLAEFLSSSPTESIRDGRRAVDLAQRAVANLRDYQNSAEALSWAHCVLAAAYAETGNFEKAITTQQEALKIAPTPLKKDYQSRLELYQAGHPYRRPAAPAKVESKESPARDDKPAPPSDPSDEKQSATRPDDAAPAATPDTESSQSSTDPVSSSAAKIVGQVTGKDGKPLARALIRAAIPAADMRFVQLGGKNKTFETTAGDDGRYALDVPVRNGATTASIDAMAPGYRRLSGTLRSGGDARQLTISPGSVVESSFVLEPALYVKGIVLDERGKPIAGVEIDANGDTSRSSGGIERTASRPDGSFEVFNYPLQPSQEDGETEKGVIGFFLPEYVRNSIKDIYALSDDQRNSLRVVLPTGHTIAGVVFDADHQPDANVMVEAAIEAKDELANGRKATMTDAAGKFVLHGLAPGLTTLRAHDLRQHQKVEVPITLNADSLDTKLLLQPIKLTTEPQKINVLGLSLTDLTDELRDIYNIYNRHGALILDPGKDSARLGIGELAEGYTFWMVGDEPISNVRELIEKLIAESVKPEAEKYGCRVVYSFRDLDFVGTNTQYLKLTPADLRELR